LTERLRGSDGGSMANRDIVAIGTSAGGLETAFPCQRV
jgi:hypothetical protein